MKLYFFYFFLDIFWLVLGLLIFFVFIICSCGVGSFYLGRFFSNKKIKPSSNFAHIQFDSQTNQLSINNFIHSHTSEFTLHQNRQTFALDNHNINAHLLNSEIAPEEKIAILCDDF